MNMKTLVAALAATFAAGAIAFAAGTYTPGLPIVGEGSYCQSFVTGPNGQTCAQTIPAGPSATGTGNYLIPADTQNANGIIPQTVAVPLSILGNYYTNGRNLLDNGALAVQQRGTGTVTCAAAAAITSTAYGPDRWGCSGNVTSGQGRQALVTSSPAPPTGFNVVDKVWRNSAALTQPICVWQEVTTVASTAVAGQQLTFSAYVAALAGLVADNGGIANLVIISGTGTDQGFGTMTASPAITPAWTGIATVVNTPITLTTTFARFSTTVTIPAAATELAAGLCFTPTATGAGATDGFAFVGAQLEVAPGASTFEFRPFATELLIAQSYYVQWADGLAATFTLPGTCAETTSGTVAACTLILPTTMRATPTSVVSTATSFGMTKVADGTAGACSTLAVIASSNSPNSIGLTCALSETAAVGTMHRLIYANSGATNLLTVSADF